MPVDATNLIMGPGTLWTGAFGVSEPADTLLGLTSDPGAGWRDVGGTNDGVTLTIAQEFEELEVDQLVDVPERRRTKREFTIETNLAEVTLENLVLASNGGTINDAITDIRVYEPQDGLAATQPTYSALLFDGYSPGGQRRRVIVRKALSTDDVETAYAKDDQTVYSVTFSAHYVSASIKPFKIIDEDAA